MEFKRVLFLKKQMVQKMGKQAAPLTEQDAFSMDALTLAYMGDVVWSLFFDIAVSRHAARCKNNGEISPHLFDPGLIRAALSIEDDDHLQIIVRPVVFQKIDQLLAA